MSHAILSSAVASAVLVIATSSLAAEPARPALEVTGAGQTPASEDRTATEGIAPESGEPAQRAANAGLLLPTLMAPQVYDGTAHGGFRSGYDGSTNAFVARALAEASLTDFLALRLEFEHGPSMGPEDRLRIGGRVALLEQGEHGIDGGVALFYDPKDFREEGNVVAGLLMGRNFGALGTYLNVLFGSDPEADDQNFELRLSSLYRAASTVHVGVDGRARYNLSSDEKRAGTLTTDWEVLGLGTASWELGTFAIVADAGISARQTKGPFGEPGEVTETDLGVIALGGAAGAF